jgi:hypothetical protein
MTGVTPEKARIQSASFHEAQRLSDFAVRPHARARAAYQIDPGAETNSCQFCGGAIREGRRFTVPAKDRSWVAFFCSSPCALGFGVCALVRGGGPRDPGLPSLAADFGEEGGWMERLREDGVISPDHTA